MDRNPPFAVDINEILTQSPGGGPGISRRVLLATIAGAILLIAALAWFWLSSGGEAYTYTTAPVTVGDLIVYVTATGSLEPVNEVEVGTEVSGTVRTVHADFNDRVRVGQVLARLGTELYEAQVAQSRSTLKSAEAQRNEAVATVVQTQEELKKLERLHELSGGKLPARQEILSARASYERAVAGQATAEARIEEARARLGADEVNLTKTVIRSPINGIVLQRQVDPGQTVAASLQTPVLFLLAENLSELHLTVDVDEADIGRVKDGQQAMFTVDAYPDKTFSARIQQVRYAPETVDGVVTYETVLLVNNQDLLLRPGMTATARILVQEQTDVLLIENRALRFAPPPTGEETESRGGGLLGALLPRRPRNRTQKQSDKKNEANEGGETLWILKDGEPRAVQVRLGLTDGESTVVLSELQAGDEVLVDMIEKQ